MANPRFGGDDLPPLSRSDGEEVSPLPDDTRDGLLPLPRPPNLATRNKVCKNSDLDLEELVAVLHGLEIPTNIERHLVRSEREEDDTRELRHRPDGVYCKNLLLKDKKGLTYLIICHEDDLADLKVVKYHLHAQGNVYFASRDSVWNLLRVLPGAVTPLALIHPSASGVRVHIDASLMDRVDRDVTKLYFHPLRAELQVSLTLAELERFLNHCGATLNRLPSLTSYTAGRRFQRYEGGGEGRGRGSHGYWQRKMLKMMQDENQDEEEDPGTCDKDKASPAIRPLALREKKDGAAESDGEIRNDDNDDDLVTGADTAGGTAVYSACGGSITMGENGDTGESCGEWQSMESELGALGIQVEVVPAVGLEPSTNTCIACKSVFMKDKRDNHFLLVCHELQKMDFSNLKTQLKPRKKITPLEAEELWSLSRIHQQFQTPFHLTRFKQPRVLVAMADNLQTDKKHNVMLTFPHPAVDKLRVKISLHDLMSLVGRTHHDVVTIPVKGSLQSLEASRAHPAFPVVSPSPPPDSASVETVVVQQQLTTSASIQENNHYSADEYSNSLTDFLRPNRQGVFYRMTSTVRKWIHNVFHRIVQIMYRFLPRPILALWSQSSLAVQRFPTSSGPSYADGDTLQAEPERKEETRSENKDTKLARLRSLSLSSGGQVEILEASHQHQQQQQQHQQHQHYEEEEEEAESCKMSLLQDKNGQHYVIITTDGLYHQIPRYLRKLGAAFRSSGPLTMTTPDVIRTVTSWNEEELSPLALLDIDRQVYGRVRVGLTGALYSFPETFIKFDLLPLGVCVRLRCSELERLVRRCSFRTVYLP